MLYCPTCFAEYREGFTSCSECETHLVGLDELSKLPEFQRTKGVDTARFVKLAVAEDPFECEAFCDALEEAGIPVLARARLATAMDQLTSPLTHDWWEILVPEGYEERARPIVDKRREELRSSEAESEAAAEEDEAAGEKPGG